MPPKKTKPAPRTCRKCGCDEDDCDGCIRRTGTACRWVDADTCSACAGEVLAQALIAVGMTGRRTIIATNCRRLAADVGEWRADDDDAA